MKNEEQKETTETEVNATQAISAAVVSTLAQVASGDLESGEAQPAASEQLISTVTKSVISNVDAKTSLSIVRRGAAWCWSKVRTNLTKQNVIDTFGWSIALDVC